MGNFAASMNQGSISSLRMCRSDVFAAFKVRVGASGN
jgi:hypothetical protein